MHHLVDQHRHIVLRFTGTVAHTLLVRFREVVDAMVGKEDFLHTSTCLLRTTGEGIAKQVRIAALAWAAGDNQHTLVRFLYGRCF